jgi:membrane fusion protein, multidrug efflux system
MGLGKSARLRRIYDSKLPPVMRAGKGYVSKTNSHSRRIVSAGHHGRRKAERAAGTPSAPLMKKRTLVVAGLALLAVAGVIAAAARGNLWSGGAVAQAPRASAPRTVPVEVASAVKKTVPVTVEALGNVTPIASVAVKPRIDTEIIGVHFRDGATVNQGDLLFTLDSRAIEAQAKQVEGLLAGAKANLEQAERDVARYTELVAKNATTIVTLQNARTQVNIYRASVDSNTAQLENLNVQLSYCSIRAPITGRASMANVKVGNFVRQADIMPLATIIQTAPIYVTFSLSQNYLPELRQALVDETATIEAVIPGDPRRATGQVTMIENSVDAPTGTVPVRATMPNADELLWPGTLVTVRLTFRQEEAVVVPSTAVQVSQTGTYVFVIKDEQAVFQPVKVARVLGVDSVIENGLEGGEAVVTNGQLLLANGTKVVIRGPKVGSNP